MAVLSGQTSLFRETSTFYFTQMNAFINNALVFSFGAQFRRNVLRNWMLVAFIIFIYACQLFFMFSPPNSLTIAMHVFTEQCMRVLWACAAHSLRVTSTGRIMLDFFIAVNRRDTDNPIWQAWLEMGNEPTPAMSLGGRYAAHGYSATRKDSMK
jgi:magnesium-transporting ATPase (P-type)